MPNPQVSSLPHNSWYPFVQNEFQQPYMQKLKSFLLQKEKDKIIVYPKRSRIFYALNKTPLTSIKVVLLGQDPYPGKNQANGLAFSVEPHLPFPASLKNIFQELSTDQELPYPTTGNLLPWAAQGVLLLNTVLTVDAKCPASHRKQGWEIFTDHIIQLINTQCDHVFFILWGQMAIEKKVMIDTQKHGFVTSPHPSPLSCYRGFFGSKPFTASNKFLASHHKKIINWKLD